jgi:hypothetical protein
VPKNHWLAPVAHFAAHALVGSLVFVVIALPALGLSLLVHWLESRGAAGYVISVLTALEYVIVTIDAIAFTWHLLYSTYKAFKESIQ